MFSKGQKVVCVDDVFPDWTRELYVAFPVKDHVYTVRDVVGGVQHKGGGRVGSSVVYLEELANPIGPQSGQERGFAPERFAPLETIPAAALVSASEKPDLNLHGKSLQNPSWNLGDRSERINQDVMGASTEMLTVPMRSVTAGHYSCILSLESLNFHERK